MVIYNSLIADIAPECLEILPEGTATDKLVCLQLKLEKEYPNVVVQCVYLEGKDVIQVKGSWNDIKGIHMLLEKFIEPAEKPEELNSGKPHNALYVKTEPVTGLTDEEDWPPSADDIPEPVDHGKESSDEEFVPTRTLRQKKTPKRRKRKTKNTAKVKDVKDEPVNEFNEKEESDDFYVVGKVVSGSKKTLNKVDGIIYNDSDTEEIESEENDEETEKDEDWSQSKVPVSVNRRKRRFKSDKSNLIDPDNIDSVIQQCIDKAEVDEGNLKRDIPCILCDYKSSQRHLLRVHILRCHAVHRKTCPICFAAFGLNKDLNSHMKNHDPKIPCPHCRCKFVRQTALNKHIEQSHGDNPPKPKSPKEEKKEDKKAFYKCEQCTYITEVRRYLKHHVLRNHGEREFSCSVCNKRFGLEKDLRQHMKNHTDVNCVQCEECGKTLRSKFALQLHINSIHRGIKNMYKKEYVCDHCGKVCANKTVYNDHINKDHLNIKRFGCPLCPMSFFTKYNLRHHLVTHSAEKNFSCETCGKDFKRRSSLKIHQRIHETVRQYTCTTCNKSFHQQGAMRRHERIHTGEKPYKCSICNAAFTDYSILRRHLMGIHKQDKAASRVYLRKHRSIDGINRGGEKKDVLLINDISRYRGVFRGVQEHVAMPEDELIALMEKGENPLPISQAENTNHENSHQEVERGEDYHLLERDAINRSRDDSLDEAGHASMDGHNANAAIENNSGVYEDGTSQQSHIGADYSAHHENVTGSVTPLPPPAHTPLPPHTPLSQPLQHPEQSVTPVSPGMVGGDLRHAPHMGGAGANSADENGRPQINFSSLPLTLPDVFNPMMQYGHVQRPDLYATAGALIQAAQQQQYKYEGHPLPENYYYQNHPL